MNIAKLFRTSILKNISGLKCVCSTPYLFLESTAEFICRQGFEGKIYVDLLSSLFRRGVSEKESEKIPKCILAKKQHFSRKTTAAFARADVLQNRYSRKFRKFHRKAPLFGVSF